MQLASATTAASGNPRTHCSHRVGGAAGPSHPARCPFGLPGALRRLGRGVRRRSPRSLIAARPPPRRIAQRFVGRDNEADVVVQSGTYGKAGAVSVSSALLGGLVGVGLGGVATWLTTRWQLRKELEYGYDRELRTERVAVYKELWKLSERLPRYYSRGNPTGLDLEQTIENFHRWFFEVGGLFLSDEARAAYFAMMNCLRETAQRNRDRGAISDDDAIALYDVAENLRIKLTSDVGASRAPELKPVPMKRPPPHPLHAPQPPHDSLD